MWNVSYTDSLISLALMGFSSAAILNGFNSSADYMTVEELRHHYQVPGNCESAIKGEGQVVFVKGYIDWPNVFSKKYYPQLPYEKFRIRDNGGNHAIEIWVESGDSVMIFDQIYQLENTKETKIFVKGVLFGFDMHIAGKCVREIKIILSESADLVANKKGC